MWSTRWGGGTAAGGHRGASLPAPFYFSTALGPAARGFSLLFCPFRASGPGCFSEVQPALAHPPVFSCVGGRSDCGTLCKDHEKIKHPSLSSGDIQRSRQGGVESYGTAGPVPLFCAIFSNRRQYMVDDRAHLFECERGFWYCPIWSRAQKQEWAHSTRTWPRRGSWLPSVLLQGQCAPRANRVGCGSIDSA